MNQQTSYELSKLNTPTSIKNQNLINWVREIATLTQPDQVYWCDGTVAEYDRLCQQMVSSGMMKFRSLRCC